MEAVPLVMRFIGDQMRCRRAPHLSIPQFRAPAFLDRYPGACVLVVAGHLGVARPTVSILVDRLVRRGLVIRIENPAERRRAALLLTASGARCFQQARQATRDRLASVLREQSSQSLQQIARRVGHLVETLIVGTERDHDGK